MIEKCKTQKTLENLHDAERVLAFIAVHVDSDIVRYDILNVLSRIRHEIRSANIAFITP